MRAINLIPPELRARIPGEGDPRVAFGVFGGLVVLLVMLLAAVMYSNKATTLNDQAASLRAEADRHKVIAAPVQPYNDFAGVAKSRTLLVGGLAASRFPWGKALHNLSRSLPADVTLNTMTATTADATTGVANQSTGAAATASTSIPTLKLTGCASGWIGYSRLMVWLRGMPGVARVNSTQSSISATTTTPGGDAGTASPGDERKKNCGPAPLEFAATVIYEPRKVNLIGLPKVETDSAAGGAVPGAAPAPAAATTPAPEQ